MKKLILLCLLLLISTGINAQIPAYKNGIEIGKYVQNTQGEIFVRIHKTNEDIRVYFDGNGFTTIRPTLIKKTYDRQKQDVYTKENTFSNQIDVSNNYIPPVYNERGNKNTLGEIADKFITLGTLYLLSRNQGYGYGHGFGYGLGGYGPYGFGGYGLGGISFANNASQYYFGTNHSQNYPAHGYIRWP